jgi:hypothetical protein
MAVLSDNARSEVWAELMRRYSDDRSAVSITKADLRAAVNAIDGYLSDNASAINTTIPQPARGALSVQQKAILLMYVVQRRYLDGA